MRTVEEITEEITKVNGALVATHKKAKRCEDRLEELEAELEEAERSK